jgi:uncharacterized protein
MFASFFLRILYLIMLIWLIRRLLSFFFKTTTKNRVENNPVPPTAQNQMVKDPICGMYMDSRLAVRMDNSDESVFFCSEECRQKYLNKPPGDGMGSSAAAG